MLVINKPKRIMASPKGIWKIIAASSVGTLIEWYDFYIFGSLSTIISKKFFPDINPTAALLSTLATFAAGFIVRPFGALFFGRLGDIIGRKYTFLLTLILMGGSTFLIGLVPSYATIGAWAPLMVLLLRLLQGLGPRRRIWWGGNLCSRTFALAQAGLFYQLDTNNRHIGFICFPWCYFRHQAFGRGRRIY